jgi:XTP/dITP diphosphohydrolase
MPAKLVLATGNLDKVREISRLLADLDVKILTLADFPGAPDVVEDGDTLEANALKKAREIAAYTGLAAVADDTGLEVEALDGAPGVCSSRYSGPNATYADNVRKAMENVPFEHRVARFRTVVAFCDGEKEETVDGICYGYISETPRGKGGFGYDPVFYVPEFDQTFAEMSVEQKNSISHRGRAFSNFRDLLVASQLYLDS